MTGRNKSIVVALILALGLGLGVLLTHDWRGELAQLSARAEHALGIRIVVDGKTRLALLPLALTAERVRITRGDADSASIGRITLPLSPLALLGGRLRVQGVMLEQIAAAGLTLDRLEAKLGPNRVDGFTKSNGHNISFQAMLDPTHGNAASLRVTMPTTGAALRFEGSVESGEDGPVVFGHVSANSGHLAAALPALALPANLQIHAEADVEMGDGQYALVNLTIDGNGSHASGSLSLLEGSPALVDADLSIDHLALEAWHQEKSAALPALLAPVLTPPTAAPAPAATPPAAPTPVATTPATTMPLATTAASSTPPLPSLPLPADLFGNLRLNVERLSWQGQELRNLDIQAGLDQGQVILRHGRVEGPGGTRLDGDGVLTDERFDGRLRLNAPGLSGRADVHAAWPQVTLSDLRVNRDGTFAGGTLTLLWHDGVVTDWQGQIGTWRATRFAARIKPRAGGFVADDLTLAVDALALRGQLSADFSGPRPKLDATILADDIDLAHLPGDPHAAAPTAPTVTAKSSRRKAAPAAKPAKSEASAGPWSTAPLDWSALGLVDGRLNLEASSLKGSFGRLEHPRLRLLLDNGTATLEQLQAGWLGGSLDAKGEFGAQPEPHGHMDAQLKGLDWALLKPELAGLRLLSGKLDGHANLRSSGRSSQAMAAHLQGDLQIQGGAGEIDGIDLPTINRQLGHLESIGNILALVQTGLGGGRTPFSRITGHVTVKDGVAHSHDLGIQAEGGSLRIETRTALAEWSTDTTVSVALTAAAQTPLVLRLSGPLNNPRKVIDANALQKALVQSGLGQALRGNEGGSEGGSEKTGGRQILKNLLRAFGGGGQ